MVDLSRLEYLIGKDNINKLHDKHVLLCGVGGVGSFVAEGLCRSGLGKITLVDYDIIDSSNINRQLMVDKDNIGEIKVEVLKRHLNKISDSEVIAINKFIDDSFDLKDRYDYVIDCIDTLTSKFILVKLADKHNIPIICSLGSARRIKPENIKLTTLDKTRNDPLAKAFRQLVKKENFKKKIEVVYVDTPAIKTGIIKEGTTNKEKYPLGSTIFVVGSVGLYIASIVFNRLIGKE